MVRIAHIGNIASNAYLNAKFQRRLGIEADSFDLGGGNAQWLPWWEEADLDPRQLEGAGGWYDWTTVADITGVQRPLWAKILGADGAEPWYDTQEAYQADLARWLPSVMPMSEETRRQRQLPAMRDVLAQSPLSEAEQAACAGILSSLPAWRSILELSRVYDLLVLYGPHASYGCVLPKGTPYVTFEHSTMRLIPWLDQPEYHSLAAGYRHAAANVITNADCGESAWMLGLDNTTFIPHPLDDEYFSPEPPEGDEEARRIRQRINEGVRIQPPELVVEVERFAQARQQLASLDANPYLRDLLDLPAVAERRTNLDQDWERTLRQLDAATKHADLLLFAPARQSRSARTGAKRNDRIFYALKRYVETEEPRGAPRLALVAGAWGTGPDVTASAKLVHDIGLAERVVWLQAQPKRRMVSLYRAADIVLDQFSEQVGSFGTVTAEALACAKPVITHVDPSAHAWCLDALGGSLPPVCQARTANDVYAQLTRLVESEERRRKVGAKSRAWIDRCHSWRVTTERSLALYARVLGVSRESLTTLPLAERLTAIAPAPESALAGELVAAG